MRLFACDLDNTLFSSKTKDAPGNVCIECLSDGRKLFMDARTVEALRSLMKQEDVLFLPVTSRSIVQYTRITWPDGCAPEYAVTTNGAVLLRNNESDLTWWQESETAISPYTDELNAWCERLQREKYFVRSKIVDDSFLYGYADVDTDVAACAECYRKQTDLHVAWFDRKIYFFPDSIDKGTAVSRFCKLFDFEKTISAGDSFMDIPMLETTDAAIIPFSLKEELKGRVCSIMDEGGSFPDFALIEAMRLLGE